MINSKKISMTVNEELFNKYKILAEKNGLKYSTRFNLFLYNEVERLEKRPEDIDFFSSVPRLVEDICSIERRVEVIEKALDIFIRENKIKIKEDGFNGEAH